MLESLILETKFGDEPIDRSSHRKCSVKKGALRNFAKFTGKNLCQKLFFNKVEGLSLQRY